MRPKLNTYGLGWCVTQEVFLRNKKILNFRKKKNFFFWKWKNVKVSFELTNICGVLKLMMKSNHIFFKIIRSITWYQKVLSNIKN